MHCNMLLTIMRWNLEVTNFYIMIKSSIGIMNYFLNLSNRKYIEKNLNITKPFYSKDILPVPWPYTTSRLHCFRDVKIQGW